MIRRFFTAGLGSALILPSRAFAATLATTPQQTEGPFYPVGFPADADNDLVQVRGQAVQAMGTVLHLEGRVLDTNGRTMPGAQIEIWQCDAQGQYHHVGGPEGDENFQGFGFVNTDAEGHYSFRTIKPVPYPGRTPHIHFTVLENNRRRLTSQMFIEGEPGNARDGLYRSLGADAKGVTMKLESAGAGLKGYLEIVVA